MGKAPGTQVTAPGQAAPSVDSPNLVLKCFCTGLHLGPEAGQPLAFFLPYPSLLFLLLCRSSFLQLCLQEAEGKGKI